ncbi:DUF1810 domain-containing protein [Methylocystis sp. Sn-Cys]|uniref:DUF1810 domain-containing protein n=1 Tax=Methylocystis sp. Sn-Cys TaxID=1701263 RepID=UPI0019208273|nr:DUF1810 domain-containing protein [Methylocystis sp. Sn-Cys]MBL1256668.1 DUF1810 domain-containing protein [Methylocystis sp. Sn-Cys]
MSAPDNNDPFNLQRFIEAQRGSHAQALAELRAGRKTSHWIWYVFPQLTGLGFSQASRFYGLCGLNEARAYLAHPVLGPRLRECVDSMLATSARSAEEVLGSMDALKFRSSMTLFAHAAPQEPLFARALARFFDGAEDPKTLELLKEEGR